MKILVTGAAGFIGAHVAKRLVERGDEVVGLDAITDYYDVNIKYASLELAGISKHMIGYAVLVQSENNANYRFTKMNLEDLEGMTELFDSEKFDVVCHLAAQAGVRYSLIKPQAYIQDYEWFAPRKPSENREGKFIFLFIGRLIHDKGIRELHEAAYRVKQEHPEVECRVLGSLWTKNLKAMAVTQTEVISWRTEDSIHYLGETVDVRPFIAAADCVVLPSYREGTSNVLLEGASMGKPLIASDVAGCREVIDDGITGFLCAPRNADDLYIQMSRMIALSEAQRHEMGRKGREKVIREFDKKYVIEIYLRAIKENLRE